VNDVIHTPDPRPFWFIGTELATELWHSEIGKINLLIEQHPEIRNLFDAPQATDSERKFCFALLAHRKVLEIIEELFAGRYEQFPNFGEEQSKAINSTQGLVTSDAPDWTLEMNRVVDALPYHLFNALPEPLRRGGFNSEDTAQMSAIRLAAETLGTVEQIRKLIAAVLDQQLKRLVRRWPTTLAVAPSDSRPYRLHSLPSTHRVSKRKSTRTADKRRIARDQVIAQIDDASESIADFIQKMDDRHVKPQPTWNGWPGSWTKAYKNPRLRALIHKDKSRAILRAGPHK
jgi:hypothetical protein